MAHFMCTACGEERHFSVESPSIPCASWRNKGPHCPLCIRIKPLKDRIAQTRAFMAHLEAHCATIMSGINTFHDPFTALLPTELASRILGFCVDSEHDTEIQVPLALSAVSKRWRAIARSTPSLWASIPLRLNRSLLMRSWYEEMLRAILQLSEKKPFSININIKNSDRGDPMPAQFYRSMETLNAHWYHCRDLSMEMPLHLLNTLRGDSRGAPALRYLSIHINDSADNEDIHQTAKLDLGAPLPAPDTICLSSYNSSCGFDRISVDWRNVTNASLSGSQIHKCHALFMAAPQLRECRLRSVVGSDSNGGAIHPNTRIIHTHLTELHVQIFADETSLFFEPLSFPSLKILACETTDQSLDPLSSFLIRSSCPITSLAIAELHEDTMAVDQDAFLNLLRSVPTLEELKIYGIPPCRNFFEMLSDNKENSAREQGHFLPLLTRLTFDQKAISFDIPWPEVCVAVKARASRDRAGRGMGVLQQFCWSVANHDGWHGYYNIDQGSLKVFEQLIADGLDIRLIREGEDIVLYSIAHSDSLYGK
ncbi:unnamed protein product [Cyclocybe aegerita]|uniref:F-box domain-containing protein n=1 Tax=Cyclocybe aegerita TaxID=1973307 RepID=A0A8S0W8G4_CYCAE|nr:unnamed protein product [Cyclocybe aegerita]